MKFTNGFWHVRPGVHALFAAEAYDLTAVDDTLVVHAPTKIIERRGDVLNRPVVTVTYSSPAEGVVRVRIEHHQGRTRLDHSSGWPGLETRAASAPTSRS